MRLLPLVSIVGVLEQDDDPAVHDGRERLELLPLSARARDEIAALLGEGTPIVEVIGWRLTLRDAGGAHAMFATTAARAGAGAVAPVGVARRHDG